MFTCVFGVLVVNKMMLVLFVFFFYIFHYRICKLMTFSYE